MDRLTRKRNIDGVDYIFISDGTTPKSVAINKLGKLEDIFELIEEMYKKLVCLKRDDGKIVTENYKDCTILYNPKTNEIEIYKYDYGYEFVASYKVEDYKKTWWLKEGVEMTYGELFDKAIKTLNLDKDIIEDYRPASPMFIDQLSSQIPSAIIIWLKTGDQIIFIDR